MPLILAGRFADVVDCCGGSYDKKSINFTDPNFGLSGNMGGGKNKMSEKSKEIDMKLQQMLQDRESIDMTLNQRARLY